MQSKLEYEFKHLYFSYVPRVLDKGRQPPLPIPLIILYELNIYHIIYI